MLGRSTGALRHRDFRLLWLGESVSQTGSAATKVMLPLVAVTTLNADSFTMGLLGAAAWVPWLVIGLPAGAWIDRVRRRPVMIGCNTASAVLLFWTMAAAWWGMLTIGQLLAVALLSGAANVFFVAAYSAYIPSLLPPADLTDGNAKLQMSEAAAEVVAPSAGGALAQAGGAVLGCLVDGLTFLLSVLMLTRIRSRESPVARRPRGERSLGREIREGIGFLAGDPYLRTILACDAGMNLFLAGTQAVEIVFLSRTVGLSGGLIGALMAAVGLGGVAGALLSPWLARTVGTARAVLLCAFCGGPFGLLIPLTSDGPGLLVFLVGQFCLTACIVAGNVVIVSFRQSYCPPGMLGRVSAGIRFLMYGTLPIGSLLGGALGGALGDRDALWVLYLGNALCALLLLRGPLRTERALPVSNG